MAYYMYHVGLIRRLYYFSPYSWVLAPAIDTLHTLTGDYSPVKRSWPKCLFYVAMTTSGRITETRIIASYEGVTIASFVLKLETNGETMA